MTIKKLLAASLLFFAFVTTPFAQAQSSVWKVSNSGNYFYLAGTIHVLSPQDHPLPNEFYQAYKDADKLIFETDMSASKSSAYQQKFLSAMQGSNDDTLVKALNTATYERLKHYLNQRNIQITHFSKYYPWALSVTLSLIEYHRLGMVGEYGVEEHFYKKALLDKKPLGQLETVDQQIASIQSMGNIEANLMINYTLDDLAQLPEYIKVMKLNWRSGDLEALTNSPVVKKMREDFPELYNTLVVKRNNNWLPTLKALNHNNLTEFVMVGTLHLNAPDGLINQLKLAGFKVEPL